MPDSQSATIRAYRPDDLGPVIALVRELQAHEAALYDRMRPPADMGPDYVERLHKKCADHHGRIVVAEREGRVIGYAVVLTRIDEDSEDEIAHSFAHVLDLAVAAGARGQGIGRSLLAACETEARRAGAGHLRITALAANTRALDIYRAFGFADLFVKLEKPLNPGNTEPCD